MPKYERVILVLYVFLLVKNIYNKIDTFLDLALCVCFKYKRFEGTILRVCITLKNQLDLDRDGQPLPSINIEID